MAGLGGGAAVSSGAGVKPPVPLRDPPFRTPHEVSGTGIAPEVSLRATVDARGRVADVEIVKIDPSTEFDSVFADAVESILSRWRYAPALHDGRPVPAELEWTVRFVPRARRERSDAPAGLPENWDRPHLMVSPEALSRRLRSMPVEVRLELLQRFSEQALDRMNSKRVRKFSSERFVVFSDAPQEDVARIAAGNLEASLSAVHDILAPAIRPRPEKYKTVVFLYYERSSFERMRREVANLDFAAGFYNPIGLLAFHQELPSNDRLLKVLLHETTHAFVDRYVMRDHVLLPRWLGEGFADYVGNSVVRKGKLIPGRTSPREVYSSPWGYSIGRSATAMDVEEIRDAMRKGRVPTVAELMATDPETFYGEQRRMYYPLSWLLVHYLRHGNEGWDGPEIFPTFMLYVAEGFPPDAALRAVYGLSPAEMDEGFRRYVKRF